MAKSIGNEEIPVERFKEAAKRALDASGEEAEVPEEAYDALRSEYPDVLGEQPQTGGSDAPGEPDESDSAVTNEK